MKNITTLLFAMLVFTLTGKAQINLQQGLIAYYTFNNTLLDSTSNNLDLTAGGNLLYTTDRFSAPNSACQLSASNPDFFTTAFSSLNAPSELTLSAWVNLTNPFVDQKVAGKTAVGPGYLMGVDSNKLDAEIWDAAGTAFRLKGGVISPNTWTHVAISYKANARLKIYVNGVPVDSLAASSSGVGGNTTNAFCIGGTPWDNYALNLNGKIDDVYLYNRQINNQEMLALYNSTPTEIEELATQNFAIGLYPSKVTNAQAILDLTSWNKGKVSIAVTDARGRIVVSQSASTQQKQVLDLQGLENGVYVLTVTDEKNAVKTKKFVIE